MIPAALVPVLVGYVAAALLSAGLARYAFGRDDGVARAFGATMTALTVWSVAYTARLLAGSLAAKYALTVVAFVGVTVAPAGFLVLALRFSGYERWTGRRALAALAVHPVAVLAAMATNPLHGLFYDPVRLGSVAGYPVIDQAAGPLFYLHTAYSYVLLVAATVLFVRVALSRSRTFARQSVALLVGALLPWGVNALFLAGMTPLPDVDLTPVGFVAGGAVLAFGVFAADLLELTPVARARALDALDTAVLVLDDRDRVVDANAAAEALFGAGDELVGRDADAVLPESLRDPDGPDEREVTIDGDARWYLVRHLPVAAAPRAGSVVVLTDVTESRERRAELAAKTERLETFASVLSHDMRNPLSVAKGNLDLVRADVDHERLDEVADALDRMDELVDDTLELARDRGGERVDPVNLGTAAREAWEAIPAEDAALVVEREGTVEANRARLRRLLENLFVNSIEHGSTGSRPSVDDSVEHGSTGSRSAARSDDSVEHGTVSDRRRADVAGTAGGVSTGEPVADGVTVRVGVTDGGFYVEDDGPGIPADEREAVFEMGRSTGGGTGLGLAIVAEIADAHGWSVALTESEAGGARFEFET